MLEEGGYTVFFQDWDFRGSFIEQMHEASLRTGRTLVVLSDNYLGSEYARSEAWAALAGDPVGREDRVVTIKVGQASALGLLSHFAYVDITAAVESDAERVVLDRAKKAVDPAHRAKPSARPGFPGEKRKVPDKPAFPGLMHNLPASNPDFVGREEVLAKLHTLLSQGQGPAVLTQAITGLGGIGKTQIALAYCYRHFSEHGLIWWLRAETSAALAADFTLLAEPLGLDPAQDQETLIAGIRAALAAREGWLLVFDNAEDPAAVRSLLPRIGKGHVLITSRRIDWFGTARSLEIEVMQEGEATQLLAGSDPEALATAERAEAEALGTELGCLPLALGQARAYTTETGKSLAGYRTLLAASRPKMLEKGQANPGYPASVAKTWQISIEGAERECPAARPLLELLSFFSADPLPTAVLAALPEALPAGLQEELARDEAIAALKRFSLVRAEDDALTVHRLVQAVTRDALDPATVKARADAAVRLMSAALPTPAREYRNWPAPARARA